MIYYKIVNSEGIVTEYDVVKDINSFLDIKSEAEREERGLFCEKIKAEEYRELQIKFKNHGDIDYVYITKGEDDIDDDDLSFRLTYSTKRKLLILDFFRAIKIAPEVDKLEAYYKWFIQNENKK